MHIAITGGTGGLGRLLVRAAQARGHRIRVISRRTPTVAADGVEHASADVATGTGLRAALRGVDTVIHAAADPKNAWTVDVGGMHQLIEAAPAESTPHIVYVSIVGVDVIRYHYYRAKYQAERLLEASGLPYSILRATQFHSLIDGLLAQLARVPLVMPVPRRWQFQSVDAREVAERLVVVATAPPAGRVRDFGGPEVLSLGEMAHTWLQAHGRRSIVLPLPLFGGLAAGLRAGHNTAAGSDRGTVRWEDWLARRTNAPHP